MVLKFETRDTTAVLLAEITVQNSPMRHHPSERGARCGVVVVFFPPPFFYNIPAFSPHPPIRSHVGPIGPCSRPTFTGTWGPSSVSPTWGPPPAPPSDASSAPRARTGTQRKKLFAAHKFVVLSQVFKPDSLYNLKMRETVKMDLILKTIKRL
jgi:hypothetical protein